MLNDIEHLYSIHGNSISSILRFPTESGISSHRIHIYVCAHLPLDNAPYGIDATTRFDISHYRISLAFSWVSALSRFHILHTSGLPFLNLNPDLFYSELCPVIFQVWCPIYLGIFQVWRPTYLGIFQVWCPTDLRIFQDSVPLSHTILKIGL